MHRDGIRHHSDELKGLAQFAGQAGDEVGIDRKRKNYYFGLMLAEKFFHPALSSSMNKQTVFDQG